MKRAYGLMIYDELEDITSANEIETRNIYRQMKREYHEGSLKLDDLNLAMLARFRFIREAELDSWGISDGSVEDEDEDEDEKDSPPPPPPPSIVPIALREIRTFNRPGKNDKEVIGKKRKRTPRVKEGYVKTED